MADLGVNVAADGAHGPGRIRRTGAGWLRIVATPNHDLTGYFRRCRADGLKILLVLARESHAHEGALGWYAQQYGRLVDAIEVGNEPDHESDSSWTMSQHELAAFGWQVRSALPSMPLVVGGLASGDPAWLDELDARWANAVAVHPYAKWFGPDAAEHDSAPALLRRYARRAGDRALLVTEWGFEPSSEDEAIAELGHFAAYKADAYLTRSAE